MSRRWAVILAGGDGGRLRSMTRSIAGDDRPKQFCALVGEDSLLTETPRRAARAVPAHRTLVVANREPERLYCGLPSVDFSRQVLSARPDRLAVLPVRGVHWSDLGDPDRVLATRRRARTMPMRELNPVSISA
jgi:hypothetical protein